MICWTTRVSLMLVYRGILVEQTVGGGDVLARTPMLACRGIVVEQTWW